MKKIKVSVIVPVYNVEQYLEKCLLSLVEQTLKEIEIILIDDGSTDDSLNIIKDFYQKYPSKIIYRSIENSGAANARNIALSLAHGEYIGFVDSDDYVYLTMFEKMYNAAKEYEAEIVTCGYNRISMKDVQRRDIRARECFGYNVYQAPQLFRYNVPYIWNKIFKKSLIEENQMCFEPFHIFEDLVFTYKLFLKANKIIRVSETLYNYIFLREDSLTYSFSEKRFDMFKAFSSLFDYFKENKAMIHFETELLYIFLNQFFVVCWGDVRYKDIPLKYKFINAGFEFLDEQFPIWKSVDVYFRRTHKNKFLYTKKIYWKIRNLFPVSIKHKWQKWMSLKTTANWNRRGAWFVRVYRNKPVVEKRILLNPQQGSNLNGSMFYLLKYLCRNNEFLNYEIGIACQERKVQSFLSLLEQYDLQHNNITLLPIRTKKYVQYLATAKYLFSDTSFPVFFIKREEQIYVNTWHGTPLKTLGRSTAKDYYDIANLQKNFLMADYLLYPSYYMKEHMFADYMLTPLFTNKILYSGYPRNEIFFDNDARMEVKKANQMINCQNIAYMPTWRGTVRGVNSDQLSDIEYYLSEIDKKLRDSQRMYVNLHPYLADKINYNRYMHIRPFPGNYETYDFLNACDVLITDYSSVFFDFAITKRKIILFAYDEEEYFKDRGVYISLEDLPFSKVNTVESLIDEINSLSNQERESFLNEFSPYECGDVSKRICDHIILNKETDLKIIQSERNEKDSVMLHINSFQINHSLRKFINVINNSNLLNRWYYFTYDTKKLMGREKYIERFPKELFYWGKLDPFSTSTLLETYLLNAVEERKVRFFFFKHIIQKVMSIEKKRAYGNVNFSYNIIWGKEKSREIIYVSKLPGIRIMYLQYKSDINWTVSAEVYEAYTYIIVDNLEIEEELKKISNRINIIRAKVESLDDLFASADKNLDESSFL